MKNAFTKETFRYLRDNIGRFIGIFAIVTLGMFVYAGLGSTGSFMKIIGSEYFDKQNFFDIRVISTYGINQNDIDAINALDSVEQVEGTYILDMLAGSDAASITVKSHSIPIGSEQKINTVKLISGRHPQQLNEVLVEQRFLDSFGIEIGDTFKVQSGRSYDILTVLRNNTYRVVGVIDSPLYFSNFRESSSVGKAVSDAYLYIPEQNYKQSIYSELYVKIKGVDGLNKFKDEYYDIVKTHIDEIEEIGDVRIPQRKNEVTKSAYIQYETAKEEYEKNIKSTYLGLDKGGQSFYDADMQLVLQELEMLSSETQLADAYTQLDKQKSELENSLVSINTALSDIDVARTDLHITYEDLIESQDDVIKGELDILDGKLVALGTSIKLGKTEKDLYDGMGQAKGIVSELQGSISAAESAVEQLKQKLELAADPQEKQEILTQLTKQETTLATLTEHLDQATAQYEVIRQYLNDVYAGREELDAAYVEILQGGLLVSSGKMSLHSAFDEVDSGFGTLDSTESMLLIQKAEVENGLQKIDDAYMELDNSIVQINQSRATLSRYKSQISNQGLEYNATYSSAKKQLDEAKISLDKAYDQLLDISDPTWYVLNRKTNLGSGNFNNDTNQITSIGTYIPLIFFLVAALVSLTTMSRLADEQRTSMGTFKALGYSNRQIMLKFILYAFIPTFLAGLVGGALGLKFFPDVIVKGAYSNLYNIPEYDTVWNLSKWGSGMLFSVASTVGATMFSCYGMIKEVPSSLMRPKAPKAGKKTLLEHIPALWHRLSFSYKVTFRNIFRYKKRLFMTLAGVGGSTALLFMALVLNHSFTNLLDTDFTNFRRADITVSFQEDTAVSNITTTRKNLEESGLFTAISMLTNEPVTAINKVGSEVDISLTVPTDNINTYITLRDRGSGVPIDIPENAAIISESAARDIGVEAGDSLIITDDDNFEFTIVIGALYESYLDQRIIMNSEYYSEIFGEDAELNTIYAIKVDGVKQSEIDSIVDYTMGRSWVKGVTLKDTIYNNLSHILNNMGAIVLFIISLAALLAMVVLVNLITLNISERMREIATLEVLGFRDKEVSTYIYREAYIVTFISAIIGTFLGRALYLFVASSIEVGKGMMFLRVFPPYVTILSVFITMTFAVIVCKITNKQLFSIDMLDALKSTE